MAVVLAHPFFLSATEKLDRIDLLHESRPEQWKMLSHGGVGSRWHKPLAKLIALMDGSYGRDSLQELVRLLRNIRAHFFEKCATREGAGRMQAVFGQETPDTAEGRDELLVEYVGTRLPSVFLQFLRNGDVW
jgi:hypothetical protein